MKSARDIRSPADQLALGRAFYAALDLDVGHFAAMWHSFNVGQMLANDLNMVSRRYGISIADFHLLGALMIEANAPMRATDLAAALNVSAVVLSGRIARLDRIGLLHRQPDPADRRAVFLALTPAGADKVHIVGAALQDEARFVRHYHALPAEDRLAIDRIMGDLHTAMNRDFLPVSR